MCEKCVSDGRMTRAEVDQQQAAARDGDVGAFLKAALPSVVRDMEAKVRRSPEETSAGIADGLLRAAHEFDGEDLQDSETALAKDFLYTLTPVELADALATLALHLARRDAS